MCIRDSRRGERPDPVRAGDHHPGRGRGDRPPRAGAPFHRAGDGVGGDDALDRVRGLAAGPAQARMLLRIRSSVSAASHGRRYGRRDPADIESVAAGEQVDVVIDVVIADPDDEVSWQPDAVRRDAAPPRHLQPHQGQQDRQAGAPACRSCCPWCGWRWRGGAASRRTASGCQDTSSSGSAITTSITTSTCSPAATDSMSAGSLRPYLRPWDAAETLLRILSNIRAWAGPAAGPGTRSPPGAAAAPGHGPDGDVPHHGAATSGVPRHTPRSLDRDDLVRVIDLAQRRTRLTDLLTWLATRPGPRRPTPRADDPARPRTVASTTSPSPCPASTPTLAPARSTYRPAPAHRSARPWPRAARAVPHATTPPAPACQEPITASLPAAATWTTRACPAPPELLRVPGEPGHDWSLPAAPPTRRSRPHVPHRPGRAGRVRYPACSPSSSRRLRPLCDPLWQEPWPR